MYEIFSYLDNGYLEKTIIDGCNIITNIITALLIVMSLALAINFAFGISKICTYSSSIYNSTKKVPAKFGNNFSTLTTPTF